MESVDDTFQGTTLAGHIFKFVWILDPRLPQNNEPVDFQSFFGTMLEGGEYFMYQFYMAEKCHIKWEMICKAERKNKGSLGFSIGLKRRDSEHCSICAICSANINFYAPGHKVSKSEYFEMNFNQKNQEYFTREMILSPSSRIKTFHPQFDSSSDCHQAEKISYKFWISGFLIAQNCCQTGTVKNEMMYKNISQMQQDFKSIFKSKQIADVSLNVKNENLSAHKFVLIARSPVFQRMFAQDMMENNQNAVQIEDIEKPVMEAFLSFLYTGVLEGYGYDTIFALYSVADKYEVQTLFKTCSDILAACIKTRTVIPVLKLANMHNDEDLKDIAVKYIILNFPDVETTEEWGELLDKHPRLASNTLRRVSTSFHNLF